MTRLFSSTPLAGVIAGLLFSLHALIPNSHSWPLLWPFLGGAVAVHLATRQHHTGRGVTHGFALGLRAGVIAAIVFLVATIPTVYLLAQSYAEPLTRRLGGDGPLVLNGAMFLALVVVAALGVALSAIGGGFAYALDRQRPDRAHSRSA